MHDVLVIGAGPAGCIASIALARRGHRVCIVEQHRFPRDKVCGECLSAMGMDVLERLALKQSLTSWRPTCLTHSELISPSGEIATIELPESMWGLSRAALDNALLQAAVDDGVEVIQAARYESGVVRDLTTNTLSNLASRLIILADGKAPRAATTDLGVKAHFTGVRGGFNSIALFGLHGHYVGLAPIEGGRWNLAMSVPAERVRAFHGQLDRLFAQMLTENVELARRMREAQRASDWLTCPLPRFAVSQNWQPNVIPIGNAAAALEPIGGEGMGLAMRSAELATDAVHVALRDNRPIHVGALQREYERLWKWRSRMARATALLMSRPWGAELLVKAMQSCESAVRPALVPLGK